MFFSGNDTHSFGGNWHTGLAVGATPLGPFRMTSLKGRYLNGGTAASGRWLYEARTLPDGQGELARSRDGIHWRRISNVPQAPRATPYQLTGDYGLTTISSGLRVWALARRSRTGLGGDLVTLDRIRGRWVKPRTLLGTGTLPWENLDVGEPAPVTVNGRDYLTYTATAQAQTIRSLGLAVRTSGQWRRCSTRPLVAPGASWGPRVAVDSSPLVIGRRLYLYYGGGTGTSIAADLGGAIGVRVYRTPK